MTANIRILRGDEVGDEDVEDFGEPDGGVLNAILGLGNRLWMTRTEG